MKPVFVIVLFTTLAACSGHGRPESPVWFRHAPQEVIVAHYQDICASYGFKPGTEAMAQCIASEVQSGKTSSGIRSANTLAAYNTTNQAVVGN